MKDVEVALKFLTKIGKYMRYVHLTELSNVKGKDQKS